MRPLGHRSSIKFSNARPRSPFQGSDGESPPPSLAWLAPIQLRLRPVVQPLEPPRVTRVLEFCLAAIITRVSDCWALLFIGLGNLNEVSPLCSPDTEAKCKEEACDEQNDCGD